MYDPTYDPVEHLDRLKVRIVEHTLRDHDAIWVRERRMVIRDRGLRSDLIRPVLAHEARHAEREDPGGHHPRHEANAHLISALRLINPSEWSTLTRTYSDYDRICLELGITRGQFRAYAEFQRREGAQKYRVERIANTIYVDPRMGAGQWARKYEVA